jgi:hypothetical protein
MPTTQTKKSNLKTQFIVFLFVLFFLSAFTIFVYNDLAQEEAQYDAIDQTPAEELGCYQVCPDYSDEIGSKCCTWGISSCKLKS